MANVIIEENNLLIFFKGLRKVAVLKSKLSVPLENVVCATVDLEAWSKTPRPFQKIAGTDSYGFYFGGSFRREGKKVFYDLAKKETAVVIKLQNSKYDRLIIGTNEPNKTAELINSYVISKEVEQNEEIK